MEKLEKCIHKKKTATNNNFFLFDSHRQTIGDSLTTFLFICLLLFEAVTKIKRFKMFTDLYNQTKKIFVF